MALITTKTVLKMLKMSPTQTATRVRVGLWLCGDVVVRLCGYVYVATGLCGHVAMWLRGYVAMWLCGCVAM